MLVVDDATLPSALTSNAHTLTALYSGWMTAIHTSMTLIDSNVNRAVYPEGEHVLKDCHAVIVNRPQELILIPGLDHIFAVPPFSGRRRPTFGPGFHRGECNAGVCTTFLFLSAAYPCIIPH
jgi:hypothetical protein